MEIRDLYQLVEDFYGYKASMRYCNSSEKKIACVLYDSFWLECGLDERYGQFGAGIVLEGGKNVLTTFLGKSCSLNSDVQSIKESLQIIDDYCRLRLPDKFLDAYYKAYVLSQYEDCDMISGKKERLTKVFKNWWKKYKKEE